MEIERKFLVDDAPALSGTTGDDIRQGYLPIADEEISVRVRQRVDDCFLAIKQGQGLQRQETSVAITESQFRELWPLTEGRRIEKTRHTIPLGEHIVDFDVYHGVLEGFTTAEVEFETREEAEWFTPPTWFGREVTDDERYTNERLAQDGLPDASGSHDV